MGVRAADLDAVVSLPLTGSQVQNWVVFPGRSPLASVDDLLMHSPLRVTRNSAGRQ